jgi:hypothetical protein
MEIPPFLSYTGQKARILELRWTKYTSSCPLAQSGAAFQ